MASVDLAALDEERLAEWLLNRRWFGSKARDVASIHVLDVVEIHDGPPALAAAVLDEVGGVPVYDAFADPRACDLLGGLLRDGAEVHGEHARIEFHWREDVDPPRAGANVRPIGAEQSNTSIVYDDALVLKAF